MYRCYEVALLDSLPPCVSACWELFCSEAFFLLLSNFTGLRLHYLSPSDEDSEEEKEEEEEEEDEEEENQEDEAAMRNRGATGSSGDRPTADENIKVRGLCVCMCVDHHGCMSVSSMITPVSTAPQCRACLCVPGSCVAGLMETSRY